MSKISPTFIKMLAISLSIKRFPKIRILRWAEITYYPFPSRKRRPRCGNHVETVWEHFFSTLMEFPSQGVPDPESRPRVAKCSSKIMFFWRNQCPKIASGLRNPLSESRSDLLAAPGHPGRQRARGALEEGGLSHQTFFFKTRLVLN